MLFKASKWPQKFRTQKSVEKLPKWKMYALSQWNRWVATNVHLDHRITERNTITRYTTFILGKPQGGENSEKTYLI
jgi:hypothetical protein